jgi:hypothetical protein
MSKNSKFILCIEEIDADNKKYPIDTRIFVYWQEVDECYLVVGKRQDTQHTKYTPFAFNCDTTRALFEIIQFIVGENKINVILYSFNNLYDKESSELTYAFYESQMDKKYEISGYNNMCCERERLVKYLRMLRNSYSYGYAEEEEEEEEEEEDKEEEKEVKWIKKRSL